MNLNQITIPVENVEQAIIFYEQLGLRLIVKALPDYARFLCEEGNATFSLHRVDKTLAEDGIWVYFETADVDQKVEELLSVGFRFEQLPQDQPWLWREARLRDLDNNQLIIYHAGENRLNPPWRISPL
jgi:catechol 2,3-dioxygenase-like lactoylglutathione lyase family enzyme